MLAKEKKLKHELGMTSSFLEKKKLKSSFFSFLPFQLFSYGSYTVTKKYTDIFLKNFKKFNLFVHLFLNKEINSCSCIY